MTEYATSAELDSILERPDEELLMPRAYLEQIRDSLREGEKRAVRWSARTGQETTGEFVMFPVVRR